MKRTLGVSYKTAWYLCHRIRAAGKTTWTGFADVGFVNLHSTVEHLLRFFHCDV